MKLLIITQALDTKHPVLGFFVRWVEEFSKHVDELHVIALQTGDYNLPDNVHVYSLGKERGAGKLQRLSTFYYLLSTLHKKYDSVFVHMNPEYIVLAGPLWRLTGKKLGLWYMHKSVDFKLRIATFFTQHIFTATPSSFRLPSKKVRIMGHGIDTDVFTPNNSVARGEHILSVGRLMKSKRHDLVLEAANEADMPVRIIGEGEERERLTALAQNLNISATFLGGLPHKQLIDEYQKASVFVHTSETGSLDKVVLEALSCGCPVVTTNKNYADMPVTIAEPNSQSLSTALANMLQHTAEDLHSHVAKNHSLQNLIPRILGIYG